jgi:hypothetical protein
MSGQFAVGAGFAMAAVEVRAADCRVGARVYVRRRIFRQIQ